MNYSYIEIAEINLNNKCYTDEICEALEQGGYKTALSYDSIGERRIRILKEKEKDE